MSKKDLRELANEIDGLLLADMPEEARRRLDEIVDHVTRQLGNEPQRWIGVGIVINAIVEPLTSEEMNDDYAVRMLISMILARLSTRPQSIAALEELHRMFGDGS